jgi:hypothetical protein
LLGPCVCTASCSAKAASLPSRRQGHQRIHHSRYPTSRRSRCCLSRT